MTEDFLHFIWKFKYFTTPELKTTLGQPLRVLQTGQHNHHAGPDFLNAALQIEDKVWAGHVEIHIKSSHWQQHKHQNDEAYKNVILHVVYEDDGKILNNIELPTLQLNSYINPALLQNYEALKMSRKWIPCQDLLPDVREITKTIWLERMAIERLEHKAETVLKILEETKNHWPQTLYLFLCKNFGFKVNNPAFEALAKSLPYNIVQKFLNMPFQMQALFFGQAGFLEEDFTEEYLQKLQKEYRFQAKKFGLFPIQKHQFKYLRMRPANFPTLRISQLANLWASTETFFAKILEIETIEQAKKLFKTEAEDYWKNHSQPQKSVKKPLPSKLGSSSLENIVINTIAPVQFAYSLYKGKELYKERALDLLLQLSAENNLITRSWQKLGFSNNNALESQALIQLKNLYCNNKFCLSCGIGSAIIKKS